MSSSVKRSARTPSLQVQGTCQHPPENIVMRWQELTCQLEGMGIGESDWILLAISILRFHYIICLPVLGSSVALNCQAIDNMWWWVIVKTEEPVWSFTGPSGKICSNTLSQGYCIKSKQIVAYSMSLNVNKGCHQGHSLWSPAILDNNISVLD